ncbi:unnamed protein product [Owenia fusiformis]|uniref:Uncharacterized protein n=1 Tax=Owenia fusiformis TaxID=6347 RepID=A0A8J1XXH3_OWEFU|nr:unnamed protein product [Owenia fusiformis]
MGLIKTYTIAKLVVQRSGTGIFNRAAATNIASNHCHLVRPFHEDGVKHCATKAEVEESVKQYKKGNFSLIADGSAVKHFRSDKTTKTPESSAPSIQGLQDPQGIVQETQDPQTTQNRQDSPNSSELDTVGGAYTLPHPIWSTDELEKVEITHNPPKGIVEHLAYWNVQTLRRSFDFFSGFSSGKRTEKKWLTRFVFLETVAGVPGMVAAMTRHLKSLRRMSRDHGWIHTLLEEAENERMHLMTVIQLKDAGILMRLAIMGSQGVFVTLFSLCYLVSPRFCHKFVGYLEEEAVKTYTGCIMDIDSGNLVSWKTKPAPEIAINYWNLARNATMRDVILNIRADEAHHRLVNHTLGELDTDDTNPYPPGY